MSLQVLETKHSTLRNTVLAHILPDVEGCELSVGPRIEKCSAAGPGCCTSSPAAWAYYLARHIVLELPEVGKDVSWNLYQAQ